MSLDINIRESLLFLIAARETLTLFSEDQETIDFLVNEASDYEILSLLIDGLFPEEKHNIDEEIKLFDKLHNQIISNESYLVEMFGADFIEPMKKLHTPYPFSSSKPDMDHQQKYLEEKPLSKAAQLQLQRSKERILKARELAKKKDLTGVAAKGKDVAGQAAEKTKDVLKKAMPGKKALPSGWGDSGVGAQPALGTTTTHGKEVAHGLQQQLQTKINTIGKEATSATSGVGKALITAATSPTGQLIAAGALASLAIYASYKTYKSFLSKAARACGDKKGSDKTVCRKNYQIAAYNGQIKDLQAASKGCKKSKNPQECVAKINKKVQKIKQKMLKAK